MTVVDRVDRRHDGDDAQVRGREVFGRWVCGVERKMSTSLLTRVMRQHRVDVVGDEAKRFVDDAEGLFTRVRDLLESPHARDRVRAARHLRTGAELLEHRVLLDAHAAGMTWEEVGAVYGVSRQAAHRRFSDETVVSGDVFEELLESLDEPPAVVPALAQAAKRVRHANET